MEEVNMQPCPREQRADPPPSKDGHIFLLSQKMCNVMERMWQKNPFPFILSFNKIFILNSWYIKILANLIPKWHNNQWHSITSWFGDSIRKNAQSPQALGGLSGRSPLTQKNCWTFFSWNLFYSTKIFFLESSKMFVQIISPKSEQKNSFALILLVTRSKYVSEDS